MNLPRVWASLHGFTREEEEHFYTAVLACCLGLAGGSGHGGSVERERERRRRDRLSSFLFFFSLCSPFLSLCLLPVLLLLLSLFGLRLVVPLRVLHPLCPLTPRDESPSRAPSTNGWKRYVSGVSLLFGEGGRCLR